MYYCTLNLKLPIKATSFSIACKPNCYVKVLSKTYIFMALLQRSN